MSQILRHVPPVPPGFADRFLADGWRGVERLYGARTDLLLKWIEMSGGEVLHERRKQHMRDNGIRPFRRQGGNRRARPTVMDDPCPAR